ncbi:MAG: Kef-type K+ ransport system NAD-binding protein [Bacteroidetes bacterium]|nr:MAG: Kef-type K+ ransport system NAD-binding protein [Bacteroidota bacterium]
MASLFLIQALKNSREKILVFFGAVLIIVTIVGTIMYLIEGPSSGFVSIPVSIYWAIVTITTVGYGDISPVTPWGQFIASLLMLTGYAIIAVPTGILTSEISKTKKITFVGEKNHFCRDCGHQIAEKNANYCSNCGSELHTK